ncbi:MAG: MFS transporter [Thermogutta sp.]|nr:MFS transporter [Thermogutta sp.]
MDRKTFRLVLLVSCCHALVHVYEQSFSSVEQLIAETFGVSQATTGLLGTSFRLPFGLCALAAGWLADRWGQKVMLAIYLVGCGLTSLFLFSAGKTAAETGNIAILFVALPMLGLFASIYHPAGLALIAQRTTPENRPLSLGYHGILGSLGIAAGPLLASWVLYSGGSWQSFYLALSVPGIVLALVVFFALRDGAGDGEAAAPAAAPPFDATGPVLPMPDSHSGFELQGDNQNRAAKGPANADSLAAQETAAPSHSSVSEEKPAWRHYFLLITATTLAGFVYSAVMTFLPRYLDDSGLFPHLPRESVRNILSGTVLLLGMIGQYTAGRWATPRTLERMLAGVFWASLPLLIVMGAVSGTWRVLAAAVFMPVFFMHQPLYNSLVAKYVPRRRRSMAYGLSFTLSFGGGSIGPAVVGFIQARSGDYGNLAAYAVLALTIGAAAAMVRLLARKAAVTQGHGH